MYVSERNQPKWRQQPTTNFTYSVYRTALAKLTKQRPTFLVVPASGDSDDRASAELGLSLLKYWYAELKTPKTVRKMLAWVLTAGTGYINADWDTDAGAIQDLKVSHTAQDGTVTDDVPADEDGNAYLDEAGAPDMTKQPHRVGLGDVRISSVDPMWVRYNPEAESPEEAEEWLVAEPSSVIAVAEQFGLEVSEVDGVMDDELISVTDMITSAVAGSGVVAPFASGSDNTQAKGKRTLLLRYYRKPCPDYPEGRHWIQAGRKIVQPESGLPEGFWPPYVAIQDTPIPGQAHAIGMLQNVIGLNERINTIDGRIREANETMARGGKWVVSPADQQLVITSDPAQVLISKGYADGKPPVQTQPKGLPPQITEERATVVRDLQVVSAMSEIAMGQKPEGVDSGRGLLTLQEATDSVLGPTLEAMENGLAEVGRRLLVLAQRHYKEERTVKIAGENGQWQFRSFKGADLTDGLDVQCQAGSSFPWSKSARMDMILQLLGTPVGLGLVVDPSTGKTNHIKLSSLLNVGGIEAFQSDQDPDADEIEREHAQFENGENVEIGFWQDHAAHWSGHADFLKRDRARFDRWNPASQKAFLAHVQQTEAVIGQAMGQMAQGAQAMQEGGQQQPPQPMPGIAGPQGQQDAGPSEAAGPRLMPSDFKAAGAR